MPVEIKIRCYYYSVEIVKFLDSIETKRIHYSIIDQLLRSSTSIGANVVEAKSAHSRKDFIKFYVIALKSANEAKYWLCLLRDGVGIEKKKIEPLLTEVDEISRILAASIIKLKKKVN